jgi:hypothetical protein
VPSGPDDLRPGEEHPRQLDRSGEVDLQLVAGAVLIEREVVGVVVGARHGGVVHEDVELAAVGSVTFSSVTPPEDVPQSPGRRPSCS